MFAEELSRAAGRVRRGWRSDRGSTFQDWLTGGWLVVAHWWWWLPQLSIPAPATTSTASHRRNKSQQLHPIPLTLGRDEAFLLCRREFCYDGALMRPQTGAGGRLRMFGKVDPQHHDMTLWWRHRHIQTMATKRTHWKAPKALSSLHSLLVSVLVRICCLVSDLSLSAWSDLCSHQAGWSLLIVFNSLYGLHLYWYTARPVRSASPTLQFNFNLFKSEGFFRLEKLIGNGTIIFGWESSLQPEQLRWRLGVIWLYLFVVQENWRKYFISVYTWPDFSQTDLRNLSNPLSRTQVMNVPLNVNFWRRRSGVEIPRDWETEKLRSKYENIIHCRVLLLRHLFICINTW